MVGLRKIIKEIYRVIVLEFKCIIKFLLIYEIVFDCRGKIMRVFENKIKYSLI